MVFESFLKNMNVGRSLVVLEVEVEESEVFEHREEGESDNRERA